MLSWRSGHFNIIFASSFSLKKSWESLKPFLTRVKTIPNMVHHGIDIVADLCPNFLDVDGLHGSVKLVLIHALEKKNTQLVGLANVCIHVLVSFAGADEW